jgi:transcriptional regulator with XRE-family HTH domain
MTSRTPTLGDLLRAVRSHRNWTLKRMSAQTGIPVSTLSKIERDRLTLTYDKLFQLSERLGMRMSEFFAETAEEGTLSVTARRSIGEVETSLRVETPNYDYHYLCTELRRKRMIPVLTTIRAKSLEQFGDLVKHAGEEFIYVLRGKIVVVTEFYDPITLGPGQSHYIDSSMGHAYLTAPDCDEADVLGVMSSPDHDLMQSLIEIHEGQKVRPRRAIRSGASTPPL